MAGFVGSERGRTMGPEQARVAALFSKVRGSRLRSHRSAPYRLAAIATVVVMVLVIAARLSAGQTPVPDTGHAPWPFPDHPGARIRAAHLPPFKNKGGSTAHPHLHVDVFVNGRPVTIPALLGLVAPYSSLHTHADSGIVHLETSDDRASFTLGQLFTVWGVRLNDRCVGGYCRPETPLRVYIDGVEVHGHLRDIALKPYKEVALVVGAPPRFVPRTYDCHNAADIERLSCQGFLTEKGP